jgi:hypothetical protein
MAWMRRFTDLPLLYQFPNGGPQLTVRLKELAEGEEMRDVIGYLTTLYGDPVLFDPLTMLYLGPERRRYIRAA